MTANFSPQEREWIVRQILTRIDVPSRQLARELGIAHSTVNDIRHGRRLASYCPELARPHHVGRYSHRPSRYTQEQKEAIVRRVLNATPQDTLISLAKEIGASKELVRTVKHGRRWAEVLPDLPRHAAYNAAKRCAFADHKNDRCDLEIPESFTVEGTLNIRWCATCSSFMERHGPDETDQ